MYHKNPALKTNNKHKPPQSKTLTFNSQSAVPLSKQRLLLREAFKPEVNLARATIPRPLLAETQFKKKKNVSGNHSHVKETQI